MDALFPGVRFKILRQHFSTAFTIDGGGDDATGIACPFAAGEESLQADVLEGVSVAQDADRGGGACLHAYQHGIVGEEALSRDRNGFEATDDLQPASDTYGDLWQ